MCDAMYDSKYEPWSSNLTGTRGATPAYDPLEFIVEECHKRGMECHAWVNPMRFSTGSAYNTANDKAMRNAGWLISHGTYTIMNPALPEVRQRIVDVCRDILENYDIDGIVFDDYFYPSGIPTNNSAEDYAQFAASGASNFGDWRRENVNKTVKAASERVALNTIVQGSAAELMKKAMIAVDGEMRKRSLSSRLLLQVHDELIFEVPSDEVEEMKSLVRECMEGADTLSVPLKVSIESAERWGDMH